MQAISNHVIVKPTAEEVSESGLILTTNTSARPMHGTVISVGNGCEEVTWNDKVYFTDIVYQTKHNGVDVYVVKESQIFAKE